MIKTSDIIYPIIAHIIGLPVENILSCEIEFTTGWDIKVSLDIGLGNPWDMESYIGTSPLFDCTVVSTALEDTADNGLVQSMECFVTLKSEN